MIKPGQGLWMFSTVQEEFLIVSAYNSLKNYEVQAKEEKGIYI